MIKEHSQGLKVLFDCVFTSYSKNYRVSHLTVRGNTVCGFTEDKAFAEQDFYKHIQEHLKLDGHGDITVKIFDNLSVYTERLEQMKSLPAEAKKTEAVLETLKSVML